MLSLWFEGADPLTDPPHEIGGVLQMEDGRPILSHTRDFMAEMLRAHWYGECACMSPADRDPGAERRDTHEP